jgi:putative redox protein
LAEEGWLAEVSWAQGNSFIGTDDEGHSVVYDSADEGQRGIGPMRALLTSLGACSGMDVVSILKKRKQDLRSLKVLVRGRRAKEHGYPNPWAAIEVKYVLSGSMKPELVKAAIDDSMEKFCSVAATLRPAVKITYSYEVVP